VNSVGEIYRWTGATWVRVPGGLTRVAVGAGGREVVGVNSAGEIYAWDGATWHRIPGALNEIDCSAGRIIGTVKADQKIYHLTV